MAAHTAKRTFIIAACALLPFAAACGSDDTPSPSSSSSSTSSTSTSSTSKPSPSSSKPTESASESSSSKARPNPTREQTTESTSARPSGFTEAPGQAAPSEMNKTVASCGDPSLHETGTTFFTDGSSGWTQQCANQMMAQQPAAAPEPAPAPATSAYYPNCAAARAAGASPLYAGDPGYSSDLDRDGDGVACE